MGELHVIAENLRAKAAALSALQWPDFGGQDRLQGPSGLPFSEVAADNIWQNYSGLMRYMAVGKIEKVRLVEALVSAADAYDEVDQQWQDSFNADGHVSPGSVAPRASTTPAPQPPFPISPPAPIPDDGSFRTPSDTEAKLGEGDQGASLLSAAESWATKAALLTLGAEQFQVMPAGWDGTAAEAADVRFGAFKAWLDDLAITWGILAGQAAKIAQAHQVARGQHTPVAAQYENLEHVRNMAMMNGNVALANQAAQGMQGLQTESEEIRDAYVRNSSTEPALPGEVPAGVSDPIPVSAADGPGRPANPLPVSPQGFSAGQSGGSAPAGGMPSAPPSARTPTTPAQAARADGGPPAGVPSSGQAPSGASAPSGGGTPAGGASPGGLPGGSPGGLPGGGSSTGEPKLPTEPRVRPAAAAAGGGAAGGGAGGGGLGGGPLSPAVGAETVATGPGGAARGVNPVAGAAAGPSAMGGAMGGMPMVGHGAGQGQGKEKRRTPGLAPDEDLYTEDRPWTEAVIGNRRRKDVQDGRESK